MRWLDVAGPPGCGKSTLCYPVWGDKSVTWDGHPPPAHWAPFLEEMTTLMGVVADHPSYAAVVRMNNRSVKKMATVERMEAPEGKFPVFVQTGLVQRILGFGWRLAEMKRDVGLIRPALWWMPVSVGVAFLEASLETILARNRMREKKPATAHENRSHQVPFMLPAIAVAKDVLRERGIPGAEIDVEHQSEEDARAQLLAFADRAPCDAAQVRSCDQVAALSELPPWWRP